MVEIILAIITTVMTIIATFTGAIVVRQSNCNDNTCIDIVMETEPEKEKE